MKPNDIHPQTKSFFNLFPSPGIEATLNTALSKQFQSSLNEYFASVPLSLLGFSATKSDSDDQMAETDGNDYVCNIRCHFETHGHQDSFIIADDVPYPNDHGEFVLKGIRYFIPMFLRDKLQLFLLRLDRTPPMKLLEELMLEQASLESSGTDEEKKKKKSEDMIKHDRNTDDLRVILLDELLEYNLQNLVKIYIGYFLGDDTFSTMYAVALAKISNEDVLKDPDISKVHIPPNTGNLV